MTAAPFNNTFAVGDGAAAAHRDAHASPGPWALALRSPRVRVAGGLLLVIVLFCVGTAWWTAGGDQPLYARNSGADARRAPSADRLIGLMGFDGLGRSLLARTLLGGTISLAVGLAAAGISVVLGVTVGLVAGYRRGWVDSAMMRTVDVLYGLPYILLVILFKIAFEQPLIEGIEAYKFTKIVALAVLGLGALIALSLPRVVRLATVSALLLVLIVDIILLATGVPGASGRVVRFSPKVTNLVVLFSAIGLVSWLTMARVVRGQVLSLRAQPFIEACRAMGLPHHRIFLRHILPNLVGPITVYATLTVPAAILQESFLSFLGIGVQPPLPTWGSLASEAVQELSPTRVYWWMLLFPCALLAVTLLSLNFLGDGLRDVFDPKREAAKI